MGWTIFVPLRPYSLTGSCMQRGLAFGIRASVGENVVTCSDPIRHGARSARDLTKVMAMQLNNEQVANMIALLSGFQVVMLTTEAPGGLLRSRPMAMPSIDETGRLLFFTRRGSPKTEEIRRDQQVNISFASQEEERYVSVSGMARLCADAEIAKRYWSDAAEAWLPHGFDEESLLVIEVEAEQLECWDASARRMQAFFELPSPPARFSSEEDEWNQMLADRDSSIDVLMADAADEPPD